MALPNNFQRFVQLYSLEITICENGVFAYPSKNRPALAFLEKNEAIRDIINESEFHVYPRFYRFNGKYAFAILYKEKQKVVVGPFLFKEGVHLSHEFHNVLVNDEGITCRSFYVETIIAILIGFSSTLSDRFYSDGELIEKNFIDEKTEAILDSASLKVTYGQIENNKIHHSYEIVENLEKSLAMGEAGLVHDAIRTLMGKVDNKAVSKNELRNAKDMAISGIAIATRTAIKSGVAYTTAYGLSDVYISKIEETNSMQEINDYTILFMLKTSKLVNEILNGNKEKTHIESPIADQAMTYIRSHLSQTISLEEIASAIGVSPNYLSTLFKKESGIALNKFVQKEKIALSKKMLMEGLSESEIANNLSFSSQGHFCKAFKEQTGKTPRQFIKEQIALKNQ